MDDRSNAPNDQPTLAMGGMTLLGVLLSLGLTVAFGLHTAIVWRVVAGAATSLGLALLIALGSRRSGLLLRVTRWLTQYGQEPPAG